MPAVIKERDHSVDDQVVVVGAGVAGSTAALELTKQGEAVILLERRNLQAGGYHGNNRSVMTLTEAIQQLGAQRAITTVLRRLHFYSLDDEKHFTHIVPANDVTVAVDHHQLVDCLHSDIRRQNINFIDQIKVLSISENPPASGVRVETNQGVLMVKAVIDASGPGWRELPFANRQRQSQYQESIVCFAYGHRCEGLILEDLGEESLVQPISIGGSGRTSWIMAGKVGEIDVIYSDYVRRDQVGKVDRVRGYQQLKSRMINNKIVQIKEEGPVISGFFGLEARKHPSGGKYIFHHGEKGQYNAGTVGDAVAPTVRLSRSLAEIIHQGGTAADYDRVKDKVFPHRLEAAWTKYQMKNPVLSRQFALFEAIKQMSFEEQKKLLRDHNFFSIPKLPLLIRYRAMFPLVGGIGREYFKFF